MPTGRNKNQEILFLVRGSVIFVAKWIETAVIYATAPSGEEINYLVIIR